jgi:hypothetical protein
MAEPAWELITKEGDDAYLLERIEVPGGWLYRSLNWGSGNTGLRTERAPGVALAFVPNRLEGWRG